MIVPGPHAATISRTPRQRSFRPEQADAFLLVRSCERVGLRSGGISVRSIVQASLLFPSTRHPENLYGSSLASPIISTPSKLLAIFRTRAPLFSTVSELFRQKTPGVGTPFST
jgi:hypothetical protein